MSSDDTKKVKEFVSNKNSLNGLLKSIENSKHVLSTTSFAKHVDSKLIEQLRDSAKLSDLTTSQAIARVLRSQSNSGASDLENQMHELKKEIDEKAKALADAKSVAGDQEAKFQEILAQYEELQEKQRLSHILNRISEAGGNKILEDGDFRAQFKSEAPCKAYVLAIDIRRSTELMLKAREPKLFANFITDLAITLRDIVLDNCGVFDKFTGDGILAVFPEFYSGEDAGYRAVTTATLCHQAFESIYLKHRSCFMAVLKDSGLGIGIDYGDIQIVEIGGELTVVGTPVVYACRMSGAPAKETLVNQPGYEQLFNAYFSFDFIESEIEVKHEGNMVAYKVNSNSKPYSPKQPSWQVDSSSEVT